MLLALCVVFVASVAYAQDAQPLELGKTYTVTVPARQFKYFQYTAQNGDTLKYSVLRTSPATGGQDLTYIRKDQPPTKLDYDEIDTDAGASHVIQFTPVPGLYYFAVLNVARKPSVYNVTLTSLASKVPVLSWEGDAFPVCEGINPPMYGPPSLSVGLSSFSVTCLRKHIHSRGVVEFRKFNGALIRADSLRLPRGGLFSEPAVKFVKNTYQVSSSFAIDTRFIHLELRSYEQDGTIIQNVTTWGDTFLAETREMYPQILWNGTALKFYWHKQYEWYALYTRAFDLRGNPVNRQDYVREPVRDKDNPRLHPARVRAVLNEVEELETQEVAFFVWEGQDPSIGPRQLSFWVQVPETERQARKYIINGDSWINDTDGGIDMVATDDDDYVLVHPVAGYSTIQVTKMSRTGEMLKAITLKHTAKQPNLLVIDEFIFLTTENNGLGMITVFSYDLEIIATEFIGGGSKGRIMFAPILYYDPILDLTMVLYTDENNQALVQRLTLTFPSTDGGKK